MSVTFVDTIPTDSTGRYSRDGLIQLIGGDVLKWHLEGRPFFTVYSASRPGNDPAYIEMATQLGMAIEKRGGVAVNGGGNGKLRNNLMNAFLAPCTRGVGVVPEVFANKAGEGEGEGLTEKSQDVVAKDFGARKVIMTVLSSGPFIGMTGGLGTLDEALEAIIHKGRVWFIAPNDFWKNTVNQLGAFAAWDMIPTSHHARYSFISDPHHAAEKAVDEAMLFLGKKQRPRAPRPTPPQPNAAILKPKPPMGARDWILEYRLTFAETLYDFIGEDGQDELDASRIGVLASQNIATGRSTFNIKDPALRHTYIAQAQEMGAQLGAQHAVVILSGERKGLRALIADEVTAAGGKVIWLQSRPTKEPLRFERSPKRPRELSLIVARHHEKEWLFDLLCQGTVALSGGLHTLNQTLSHLTRIQTGLGHFSDMLENGATKDFWDSRLGFKPPRRTVHLFDPPAADGQSLWCPIRTHFAHAAAEGFIDARKDKNDLALLKPYEDTAALAKDVIADSRRYPDPFLLFTMESYAANAKRPQSVRNDVQDKSPKPAVAA